MLYIIDADLKKDNGKLTLDVMGYASTPGWTEINLSMTQYLVPPQDGIQELIINGKPPFGFQPQMTVPFAVSTPLEEPDWLLGVRVVDMNGVNSRTLGKAVLKKDPAGDDWLYIMGAALQGDKLYVEAKYGGGCNPHKFQINWDGTVIKTNPPSIVLDLSHNSLGDPCKAIIPVQLQFDLSVILDSPESYRVYLKHGQYEQLVHNPE